MGRSIILCEGETDAILLSYYLERLCGIAYTKDPKTQLDCTEETCWYDNASGKEIAITWVGGHDFTEALQEVLHINQLALASDRFDRVVVLADHDDAKSETMMQTLLDALCRQEYGGAEGNRRRIYQAEWEVFHLQGQDGISYEMKYCGVLIPLDHEGALETFVLEQLCNAAEADVRRDNQKVVREIDAMIGRIKPPETQYLHRRRDQIKARFALFLSVVHPEKAFQPLNRLIGSVDWKVFQNDKRQEQFRFLRDL